MATANIEYTTLGTGSIKVSNVFRNSTRQRLLKEVDDSLRRLQVDYIDLYQVHWPDSLVPIRIRHLLDHQGTKGGGISHGHRLSPLLSFRGDNYPDTGGLQSRNAEGIQSEVKFKNLHTCQNFKPQSQDFVILVGYK